MKLIFPPFPVQAIMNGRSVQRMTVLNFYSLTRVSTHVLLLSYHWSNGFLWKSCVAWSGLRHDLWAQALAYGPNINDLGYRHLLKAYRSTRGLFLSRTATSILKRFNICHVSAIYCWLRFGRQSCPIEQQHYTEIMARLYQKIFWQCWCAGPFMQMRWC